MTVRYVWLVLLVPLLCSCNVGSRYQKPSVQMPHAYKYARYEGALDYLASWWKTFHDPYLDELIEHALEKNYTLAIARERIEQSRFFYHIKTAETAPHVNAFGSIQKHDESRTVERNQFTSSGSKELFQVGFDTSWELDVWGRLRNIKAVALHEHRGLIESFRDQLIMVLGDVAKTYVDIRAAEAMIHVLKQEHACNVRLRELLYDRFQAGIDGKDLYLVQEEIITSKQDQILQQEALLEQVTMRLALLLGENPETFEFESRPYDVPIVPHELPVGLPSELLRRRPDIRRAEQSLMASHHLVGSAVAEWFPKISLFGAIVPESEKPSQLFSHNSISWSFGPSIQWPIITFGRIKYNIKEKKSIRKQAALQYAETVLKALEDVEHWLVLYLKTKERVAVLYNKLAATTEKSELARIRFEAGLADEQELLEHHKRVLAVHRELIETVQRVSSSRISLYKALGGGW